jgi:hypothetical protein
MLAALAAVAAGVGSASAFAAPAAGPGVLDATSMNWAGYAVTPGAAPFTNVSSAWIQPAATCTPGTASFSAFWVGLGGFDPTSQALEQVGTEANCSATGRATYDLFYELVPAPPVAIKLPLSAGDGVAASVSVSGKTVSIRITNVRLKKTFAKKLTMKSPAPDLSSAEWVAEAPSACTSTGFCSVLPLANFTGMTFVVAKATAGGHLGTISDPAWSPTQISLVGGGDATGPLQIVTASPAAEAFPTPLSPDGSSFGVTWSDVAP